MVISARILKISRSISPSTSIASILQRKLLSSSTSNTTPTTTSTSLINSTKAIPIDESEAINSSSDNSVSFYTDGIVSIRNTQRKYRINLKELCIDAGIIKSALGLEDFQLDILICSDSKMRSLNSDWRGIAKSTGE
jgi:hypothetical protein